MAVDRFSSDDSAIRYVLPVLWMTSRFPIMGHVANDVRQQYRRERRAEASSQNFQRIRQREPNCLTLLSYTVASNCEQGAKSALYDCFVMAALCNRGPLYFAL